MKAEIAETQVPGAVPSREEQLTALLAKLAGNQSFKACRGRLGSGPLWRAREMMPVKENEPLTWTRTGVLQELDEFWGHTRVMINLMAQYRRDGWTTAEKELVAALTSNHVIWGETFPIEQTTPITMLMVKPDLGLRMIKWMVTHQIETLTEYVLGRRINADYDLELKELFTKLPTLEKRTSAWRNAGYPLYWRGESVFAGAFWDQIEKVFRKSEFQLGRDPIRLQLEEQQLGHQVFDGEHHFFAYLFLGKDQGQVLSMFPDRTIQKQMATWQFNLPTIDIEKIRSSAEIKLLQNFYLGLHPEDEHERWSQYNPGYTSKGLSQGFGAIIHRKRVDDSLGNEWDGIYQRPSCGKLPPDGRLRIIFKLWACND